MKRSTHNSSYKLFLSELRKTRLTAGLSQAAVAAALRNTQTFISKCERGERRMDVIDLLEYLDAVGADPAAFIGNLRRGLAGNRASLLRTTRSAKR